MKMFITFISVLGITSSAFAISEKVFDKNASNRPSSTAPKFYSDGDLQSKVSRSLASDVELSYEARNVNVRVQNGRASLQGFVGTPQEKEILQKKVLAIEGVHSVKDDTSIRE